MQFVSTGPVRLVPDCAYKIFEVSQAKEQEKEQCE